MSWRDRPYSGPEFDQPELRIQFRKPSTAVMWLITVNVAVFVLDLILQRVARVDVHQLFGLSLAGVQSLHLWQPLTYMFLHGSLFHVLANMLGLYIFGTDFERSFGRERFLQFYGTCGLVGGLGYLVLSGFVSPRYFGTPLVGASGAVYGLLIAAIIFFPHIRVVLIIFPMPIRVFGLIVLSILLLSFLTQNGPGNLGGEVCHLVGAVTALGLFYAWGIMPRVRVGFGKGITILPGAQDFAARRREGAWAARQKKLAEEQAEVDRILAKVHDEGLNSLSRKEKKVLELATRRQREREQELRRLDR